MRRPGAAKLTTGRPAGKAAHEPECGLLSRDDKREKSGRHGKHLDADLLETVTMLAEDESLPGDRGCRKIGGIAAVRASRRALRALLSMRDALIALRKFHPEEAAKQLSRRTHGADPADRQFPDSLDIVDHSLGGEWSNHRDCHIKPT